MKNESMRRFLMDILSSFIGMSLAYILIKRIGG